MIKMLSVTPLTVVSKGIRECYDSHCKSDSNGYILGEKDKNLINQVGNVSKHASVLEAGVWCFKMDIDLNTVNILTEFQFNQFSIVSKNANFAIISTNIRAVQEILENGVKIFEEIIPKEYMYLFGDYYED